MSTGDRVARGKAGVDRVALGETVSFVCAHFKFNLASAMEYRWSFISQVTLMTVNDFMLLFFFLGGHCLLVQLQHQLIQGFRVDNAGLDDYISNSFCIAPCLQEAMPSLGCSASSDPVSSRERMPIALSHWSIIYHVLSSFINIDTHDTK
jgi:hypothetical protein